MANTMWSLMMRMQGDTRQLEYAMAIAERHIGGLEGAMMRAGRNMSAAGRAMTIGVSAPILALGIAAINAARNWETAWTGVVKTVSDGSSDISDKLAKLEKELLDMALRIPVSQVELAEIAAKGGALGIPLENIAEFTEVVAKLAVTTDLSSDAAATSLGHLNTTLKLSREDYGKLASALVHLGNKGASTESEILHMSEALAGAATIIGLSKDETLGWAAALANTGEKIEAGASSLQRFFLGVFRHVNEAGDGLKLLAKTSGMSAKDFVAQWSVDPSGALVKVIKGIDKLTDAEADATLQALGFKDIRITRALLRLLANTDNLTRALDLSKQGWFDMDAATREAIIRFGTFDSKLQLAANTMFDIGRQLGEELIPIFFSDVVPVLKDFVEWIKDAVAWFKKLDPDMKSFIVKAALIAVVLGPFLFIAGTILSALAGIVGLLIKIPGLAFAAIRALMGLRLPTFFGPGGGGLPPRWPAGTPGGIGGQFRPRPAAPVATVGGVITKFLGLAAGAALAALLADAIGKELFFNPTVRPAMEYEGTQFERFVLRNANDQNALIKGIRAIDDGLADMMDTEAAHVLGPLYELLVGEQLTVLRDQKKILENMLAELRAETEPLGPPYVPPKSQLFGRLQDLLEWQRGGKKPSWIPELPDTAMLMSDLELAGGMPDTAMAPVTTAIESSKTYLGTKIDTLTAVLRGKSFSVAFVPSSYLAPPKVTSPASTNTISGRMGGHLISFAEGSWMTGQGPAMLHPGEMVLPARAARAFREFAESDRMKGETHYHLEVQGDIRARDKTEVLQTMRRLAVLSR